MKKINNTLRKLDNKGFTLVELIIVIAIIAILIAVLAPQYTKYIERARKSNDISTAGNIKQAALTAALDPDNDLSSFTVTWATTGDKSIKITSTAATGKSNTNAEKAIQDVVGASVTPQSKWAAAATTATPAGGGNLIIKITDGKIVGNSWDDSMGNEFTTSTAPSGDIS